MIPVAAKHFRWMPQLLKNLEELNPPFDEIILVLSGFGPVRFLSACAIVFLSQVDNIRIRWCPRAGAGRNRNIGWALAKGPLVSFLDADDLYAPHLVATIQKTYQEYGFDLMLHSYSLMSEEGELEETLSSWAETGEIQAIPSSELTFGGHQIRPTTREEEIRDQLGPNLVPEPSKTVAPIHHGHATIRRSLYPKFSYHEQANVRNEDGVLARDILEAGLKVYFLPARLSAYRQRKPRTKSTWIQLMVRSIRFSP